MTEKKEEKKCGLWYCHEPYYAKGLCRRHYQNVRRFGKPIPLRDTDLTNVMFYVGVSLGVIKSMIAPKVWAREDTRDVGGFRCVYCGSKSENIDDFHHTQNCPVETGTWLLSHIGKGEQPRK